jgi:hypothetical protein
MKWARMAVGFLYYMYMPSAVPKNQEYTQIKVDKATVGAGNHFNFLGFRQLRNK